MGMAPVTTVTINTSIPGHRLLRYESRIVTGGPGPFEANGSRPDTTVSDLTVSQRVFGDAGGSRGVSITGTTIFWGGDGHNHWHITDMESGTLTRLGNGNAVGTLAKHGFLIHDEFLYNGWFLESDTTNNTAWAVLRIRKGRVNLLSQGGGV